jgi:outer membrane biosynthesis protein TonB
MDVGRRGEMVRGRRKRSPTWVAVSASLALHLLLATLVVLSERWPGGGRVPPKMRIYAVNIVSPPPTVKGPPPAEPPAPSSGPAASAPTPAPPAPPAPAPPPPPPAPEPPKATPRPPAREPAKAPEPATRAPERPKASEPRPKTNEPRPKANEPSRPTTNRPSNDRTASTNRSNERGGTRSTGTGTRGQPTGRNPDPNSAGGEGLSIQQAGMECPSPGYCENIVRQVRRYFRRPDGSSGSAEVCFTVQRDGGADDIEVNRVRGGFAFRLAVQEAVEQAGMRKAFGALPRAFGAVTLPVCVDISPQI